MADAAERIVNLALFLMDARQPVTAEQIRAEVAGYPDGQDDAAFGRMFERDKDELRASGLVLEFDEESQRYSLDRDATFAGPVTLSDHEAATLKVIGVTLASDPSFPLATDLKLALAKISSQMDGIDTPGAVSHLADEEPETQGAAAALLIDAAKRGKRVGFGYTNASGSSAPHDCEPYGLFLHGGRWYMVGQDVGKGEVRTYSVGRMADVTVNTSAPKTADFAKPVDFEVARFIRLPFQYGPSAAEFETTIRFSGDAERKVAQLTNGQGRAEKNANDTDWYVMARDAERLARFVIENGPGLTIVEPADARNALLTGLDRAEAIHG